MKETVNLTTLNHYIQSRKDLYGVLVPEKVKESMVSEENWIARYSCGGSEELGISVTPGDICYMDFGHAYLYEVGYQHFGIVLALWQKKALVVPMTSNETTYAKAYDPIDNPYGKSNLMRLGQLPGMNKPSVLFLNDMRFVNTARVIKVMAHLDVKSEKFWDIQDRINEHLFRRYYS